MVLIPCHREYILAIGACPQCACNFEQTTKIPCQPLPPCSNPYSNKGTRSNGHRDTCHNRNVPAENRNRTSSGTRACSLSMPNTAAAKQTYENLYESYRKCRPFELNQSVPSCSAGCASYRKLHIKAAQLKHRTHHARSAQMFKEVDNLQQHEPYATLNSSNTNPTRYLRDTENAHQYRQQ